MRFLSLLLSAILAYGQGIFPLPGGHSPIGSMVTPISYVTGTALGEGTTDGNTFTTTSKDTSGANFIVVVKIYIEGTEPTLTDSYGNTYTCGTEQARPSNNAQKTCWAANATVGASHTWTLTNASTFYGSVCEAAFANVKTSSPQDQASGNNDVNGPTIKPGSVTPTESHELISTGAGTNGTSQSPFSIDSGFTKIIEFTQTLTAWGCALGYKIQSAATTVDPQWTASSTGGLTSTLETFKVAPTIPTPISYITGTALGEGTSDGNTFTTSSKDTSGGNFVVVVKEYIQGTEPTLSDAYGNTYTCGTEQARPGNNAQKTCWAANATVGASHTWTLTSGSTFYGSVCTATFSHVKTSSPQDQASGNNDVNGPTIKPGTVTPSENGELITTGAGTNGASQSPFSIDSGYTKIVEFTQTGTAWGCALGYLIQTTLSATDPEWTASATGGVTTTLETFKVAP